MTASGTRNDDPSYRLGLALAEVSRMWRHVLDARLKPLGLSKSPIDAPRSLSPQVATAIKSFLDVIKWP